MTQVNQMDGGKKAAPQPQKPRTKTVPQKRRSERKKKKKKVETDPCRITKGGHDDGERRTLTPFGRLPPGGVLQSK